MRGQRPARTGYLGNLLSSAPASTNRRAIITLPWHIVDARLTFPRNNAMPVRDHLMKFDITSFQAVAANLAVEGEVCDLAHAKRSTPTETDPEIAPIIEKVGATSIAEIDRLIAELPIIDQRSNGASQSRSCAK